MVERTRQLRRESWVKSTAGLFGGLFLLIGLWDFRVTGAYKLIVIGTITLALLAVAERQRRAFDSRHSEK